MNNGNFISTGIHLKANFSLNILTFEYTQYHIFVFSALISDGTNTVQFQNCLQLNVSLCKATESEKFVVTVYNPLSHAVNHTVRIPITNGTFLVQDPTGKFIQHSEYFMD